ncbi:MAG: ribonuclease III [Chloroflexota bacterium]|nr:ribonuclease III [Chloroflexota bacterium]MDE2884994.1 ribonuclease III [Chloroflexota bacterium]
MERIEWAALERTLGVRFNECGLLRQAVIHRSYLNEQDDSELASYDRLEYLGDAFLGWVVAAELYDRYPHYDEGQLTRARAALVRGETLAEIARSIGLGAYLLLGQGEEAGGGRDRPRTLAAAVEALLGAVLLDQGAEAARSLVLRWLGPRMQAMGDAGAERDAKSALQELLQGRGLPLPVYETLSDAADPQDRSFTVRVLIDGRSMGEGSGRRIADAEQSAAGEALAALRSGA